MGLEVCLDLYLEYTKKPLKGFTGDNHFDCFITNRLIESTSRSKENTKMAKAGAKDDKWP